MSAEQRPSRTEADRLNVRAQDLVSNGARLWWDLRTAYGLSEEAATGYLYGILLTALDPAEGICWDGSTAAFLELEEAGLIDRLPGADVLLYGLRFGHAASSAVYAYRDRQDRAVAAHQPVRRLLS
jgi:hypothetical protein